MLTKESQIEQDKEKDNSKKYCCLMLVEHLAKTSRRRGLSLVRTVHGHLMRPSRAKDEFSEAGICRILSAPCFLPCQARS